MRIVAGRFRGRKLEIPEGTTARPTPDRAREALFSILGAKVVDAEVADLYAGSGALGFEALSRGARKVLFVERDARLSRALEAEVARFGLSRDEAEVIRGDAAAVVARLATGSRRFDLVLADPPFGDAAAKEAARDAARLLRADGRLVVEFEWESERGAFIPEDCWALRRYGRVGFAFGDGDCLASGRAGP